MRSCRRIMHNMSCVEILLCNVLSYSFSIMVQEVEPISHQLHVRLSLDKMPNAKLLPIFNYVRA